MTILKYRLDEELHTDIIDIIVKDSNEMGLRGIEFKGDERELQIHVSTDLPQVLMNELILNLGISIGAKIAKAISNKPELIKTKSILN